MSKTEIRTLKGDWFDEHGYRADLAPRSLTVEIIDGQMFDPELRMLPDRERLIRVVDGELRCWAAATFIPDAGELERVGLA